jgi:hypothetical protein
MPIKKQFIHIFSSCLCASEKRTLKVEGIAKSCCPLSFIAVAYTCVVLFLVIRLLCIWNFVKPSHFLRFRSLGEFIKDDPAKSVELVLNRFTELLASGMHYQ